MRTRLFPALALPALVTTSPAESTDVLGRDGVRQRGNTERTLNPAHTITAEFVPYVARGNRRDTAVSAWRPMP